MKKQLRQLKQLIQSKILMTSQHFIRPRQPIESKQHIQPRRPIASKQLIQPRRPIASKQLIQPRPAILLQQFRQQLLLLLCVIGLAVSLCACAGNESGGQPNANGQSRSAAQSQAGQANANGQAQDYAPITQRLIALLDGDSELKNLVETSVAQAAQINPDRTTNPAQNLEELYQFVDYSLTCMPWNILDDTRYDCFATKCDQSILYLYFLLDQPLKQLEGRGLFYPSVEYLEPVYKWLTDYNNTWRTYLDSEASWQDAYYEMLAADPTWNLDQGWYEDKENWHTFNDFFARELSSAAARPVAAPEDDSVVTAPVDSLPQGVWQIAEDGTYLADPILNEEGVAIKSSVYVSVEQMLGDAGADFAARFHGGTLTHTYLSYDDYHWYHSPVSGTVAACYLVPYANAVGGVVYWSPERQLYVLESNSLSWQAVETRGCIIIDTEDYGLVAVLPIGMGQVSSVNFAENIQVGAKVSKGDPLGYFLFGGSDCVMLFEKQANFQLTVPAGASGGYANGYAHVLCGEVYGQLQSACE